MRTLVVSDLHLGSPIRLPGADSELCQLLRQEPWERVVLLGDVLDLWRATYLTIMQLHPTILATLEALPCPVIYVPGNHDDAFRGVTRLNSWQVAGPVYVFSSGGKRVAVAHGDQFDDSVAGQSRFGAWLLSVVDRVVAYLAGPGVSIRRTVQHSFVDRGPGRELYARPVLERAVAELRADVVIVGHTHVPSAPEEIGGRVVVNSGDFGPEHMTYVIVEDGRATLLGT